MSLRLWWLRWRFHRAWQRMERRVLALGDGPPEGHRHISEAEVREIEREERGSMKAGPSDDYRALLAGLISPEEYVRRVKSDVDERLFGKVAGGQ